MNEWTILPNKSILDANSLFKLIGKYMTKIVYVYNQAFKVGGNLVSTLDVDSEQIWSCPCKKDFLCSTRYI